MKISPWLTTIFLLLPLASVSQTESVEMLLKRLDGIVAEREVYVQSRQNDISRLKLTLLYAKDDAARLKIYPRIYERYNSFDADSALLVAEAWQQVASQSGDKVSERRAMLSMSETMAKAGMFKESLDLARSLNAQPLDENQRRYYYHILRSVYGFMADFSVNESQTRTYLKFVDQYRDSILASNEKSSVVWAVVRGDQLIAAGRYSDAINLLRRVTDKSQREVQENAILTYTMSDAYRGLGNTKEEERWLLYSSIADMRSGGREYISLTNLTKLLFQKGDIGRAYTYLKVCMDDASASNARLRIVEISRIFPMVSKAYQQQQSRTQKQMVLFLVLLSMASLLLLAGIFFIWRQMRRLAEARSQVVQANRQLEETGEELRHTVERLTELNHSLEESSFIKEAYIARYIDQCSVYLEKMSSYRHSLYKIATTATFKDLVDKIRATMNVDDELKNFYENFDETFIQLFPTFVEDFNELLSEESRIKLKSPTQLTPELRIFALIRLGISDSVKIAQFLRYSITTIYNYRTKMRNRAICDRDEFEKRVMKIGTAQNTETSQTKEQQ
jgi:tetratricopeptide (TPR) repeat protein